VRKYYLSVPRIDRRRVPIQQGLGLYKKLVHGN
jgi:hypothetical protein